MSEWEGKVLSKELGQILKRYRTLLYERDGPNCHECGERMILPPEYKLLKGRVGSHRAHQRALIYLRFTVGHQLPVELGGTDTLDNLAGEHFWCNKKKGLKPKLPEEKIGWIRNYARIYVEELLGYLSELERVT